MLDATSVRMALQHAGEQSERIEVGSFSTLPDNLEPHI